jgi:hypothetical protein
MGLDRNHSSRRGRAGPVRSDLTRMSLERALMEPDERKHEADLDVPLDLSLRFSFTSSQTEKNVLLNAILPSSSRGVK